MFNNFLFVITCLYDSIYRMMIFMNLVDNEDLSCRMVVWIILTFYSRKVIKISALRLREDFDIIMELECLVV
jgi:predicted DNA-binding helix-hairpin-helix protein